MNDKAATIQADNAQLLLAGELDFTSAAVVWQQSLPLLASRSDLVFDMSGIQYSNSAGLALMLEWMRYAREHRKSIKFKAIPSQLLSIARVAGVEQIFS